MRIIFDVRRMNERGTTVATLDYARASFNLGKHQPIIAFELNEDTRPELVRKIEHEFEAVAYNSSSNRNDVVRRSGADVYYRLQLVNDEGGRVAGVFNASHLVFDLTRPFGDTAAYVSKWLTQYLCDNKRPFVPHIINLPAANSDLRRRLGISKEAYVVGRHGGIDTFDLRFVQETVINVADKRSDLYFVFVNTERFTNHPKVVFLPAIIDLHEKAEFIATCDIMLHARSLGESFGLAIAEFLYFNKPYLCWVGGVDRNHLTLQPRRELIYRSRYDLERLLLKLDRNSDYGDLRQSVVEYSPRRVWRKFEEVFLSNTLGDQKQWEELGVYYKVRRKIKRRSRLLVDNVYKAL